MGEIDDLRLSRPPEPAAPPPPRVPAWLPIVAAIVAVLAGIALWYYYRSTRPEPGVRLETEQVVPQQAAPRLPAEPGEDIDLPPLDESDALVRELVARLSAHPLAAEWLATDHLIRNFVAMVVNIASGERPSPHLKHVSPRGAFQVRREGSSIVIDPRSYARYDTYASAVAGLDARGAARLFATLKPRMEEAHQELGAPDGSIERTLEKAIAELLRTPIVESGVELHSTSVAYSFADPRLESLSHAQRQLLRMGPRNMRLVQDKLREIARHLGIPDESLPRSPGAGPRP